MTLFPDMISGFIKESILKKAIEKGAVEIRIVNLREFALDQYGTVDDRPYGGGAGMVLRVDVVEKAIRSVTEDRDITKILLTSAKGKTYDQKKALELSKLEHVIIVCGHYEGFDERIIDYVDEEVSLGDFVMTGGEIAAVAIADSIIRLLPGVLKKNEATEEESFFELPIDDVIHAVGVTELLNKLKHNNIQKVQLLEYPHYTRPVEYAEKKVPEILMGGNHAEIVKWRIQEAYKLTVKKRPDLLDKKLKEC